MSVSFTSKDKEESVDLSNGTFDELVEGARSRSRLVPSWDGCHDGQFYSPTACRLIAAEADRRAESEKIYKVFADGFRAVAEHGGGNVT